MRRTLPAIAVVCVAMALTAPTALTPRSPATASASLPGPFMGCLNGGQGQASSHGLRRQPRRCGWWPYRGYSANSGNFRAIQWSSWGSRRAKARATAYGVQMGKHWRTRVSLTLSHPITCSGTYRLFTRLTVSGPYGTGRMADMRCADIEEQE